LSARQLRFVWAGVGILCVAALYILLQRRPGFFNNPEILAGIVLLELVLASLWQYESVVFPLLIGFFLWAGMDVPLESVGLTARWFVLAFAAFAGFVIWMRDRRHSFNEFHLVALFCVIAACVSAIVSSDPATSLLKVLSLFLLFLYCSAGARLAIFNREPRFLKGLLIGCEITVYLSAVAYLGLGAAIWGNPNSLGAVTGVVLIPVLLWGVIVAETAFQRHRRATALLIAGVLLYLALSRASILAAGVSVLALCISLRRQRLLLQGMFAVILFLAGAAVAYPSHFDSFTSALTSEVFYKGKEAGGLLGSRLSPWQETIAVIKERPYFGSGFGTSYMGDDAREGPLDFSPSSGGLYTKEGTNREHGNSYLALAEYVGIIGMAPFAFLILLLLRMIYKVCKLMRRTIDPNHYAVPFTGVLIAGLIHAFFEDWLFAVGYYLCVFFWTIAFMTRDVVPASEAHQAAVSPLRAQLMSGVRAATPHR
jgi:O-antigen ligase